MPNDEIERGGILRLAKRADISFESDKSAGCGKGQRCILSASALDAGARRISAELKAEGVAIGRRLASSLMKRQNLMAIRAKRFVPKTTDSRHDLGSRFESAAESAERAGRTRRSVGRRHHLCASAKRKVLLSGDVSG